MVLIYVEFSITKKVKNTEGTLMKNLNYFKFECLTE